MMNRRSHWPVEDQIRKLEDELYVARITILELLPESYSTLLASYSDCETRADTYRWAKEVAEQVASSAQPIHEYAQRAYPERRGYCPLCGHGGSGPFVSGYKIPGGLSRHLLNEGNVTGCRVMEAAMGLARDYWDARFLQLEIETERAEQAELERRRQSETLYCVDPTKRPVLIDESLSFGEKNRDAESLQWAEGRLRDLGIVQTVEGNTKAYVDDREGFVVYADPRIEGGITFAAFRKTPTGRIGKWPSRGYYKTYRIPDRWKNALPTKYESWLTALVK